jgi:hypothetical protein
MNINIDKYFDEHKPTVTIFGKSYEVDNDYKKVIGLQEFDDASRKGKDITRDYLEYALIGGKTSADDILAHDFSFEFFTNIQYGIMAAMTGKSLESVKQTAERQAAYSFRGQHP